MVSDISKSFIGIHYTHQLTLWVDSYQNEALHYMWPLTFQTVAMFTVVIYAESTAINLELSVPHHPRGSLSFSCVGPP